MTDPFDIARQAENKIVEGERLQWSGDYHEYGLLDVLKGTVGNIYNEHAETEVKDG